MSSLPEWRHLCNRHSGGERACFQPQSLAWAPFHSLTLKFNWLEKWRGVMRQKTITVRTKPDMSCAQRDTTKCRERRWGGAPRALPVWPWWAAYPAWGYSAPHHWWSRRCCLGMCQACSTSTPPQTYIKEARTWTTWINIDIFSFYLNISKM